MKASINKTPSSIFEESKNNEIAETGTPNYLPESLVMDFAKRSPGNMIYLFSEFDTILFFKRPHIGAIYLRDVHLFESLK